ncbi:hypothetical protein M1437_00175 [Patescibacteria group bacterium]|nr:hypothetical protein [Patescibacteria group bacterium]
MKNPENSSHRQASEIDFVNGVMVYVTPDLVGRRLENQQRVKAAKDGRKVANRFDIFFERWCEFNKK